jgi:hypothetical protein
MIDRRAIKFGPVVGQKELEKALHDNIPTDTIYNLHK